MKSRSSLLAPAHPGGPGKRAVKQLWCGCGVQTDGIVCNGIQTVMQRKYMCVIGGCADNAVGCLVCLSVCSHISKTTCPNFAAFSVHVTFGHGSVLLSQQCSMLCTSGFVTLSCTARLRAEGCESAGGNSERCRASALSSLHCLPLTHIPRL